MSRALIQEQPKTFRNMSTGKQKKLQNMSLRAMIRDLRKKDEKKKIQKKPHKSAKKTQEKVRTKTSASRRKTTVSVPPKILGQLRKTLAQCSGNERVNIVVFYQAEAADGIRRALGPDALCSGVAALQICSGKYTCSSKAALNVARVPGVTRVVLDTGGINDLFGFILHWRY
jgi:hypothetical protein